MSEKPILILLNPPARGIAIRDNYCSKISQAAYINHPIDLVFQSGFLNDAFQVQLIDAIVENLSIESCLDKIIDSKAKHVFSLAGNATWSQDIEFFKQLKNKVPDLKLAVSGDVFLENPGELLSRNDFIDAIILDYTNADLLKFFTEIENGSYANIVYRQANGQICDRRSPREQNGVASIPAPQHQLFLKLNYRYPFVRSRRFATVMTEFGCPFHCSFCVMGTLGCRRRPLEDVKEELENLKDMGIRDIFFLDQSFGSKRDRLLKLCNWLSTHSPKFRWVCFSRVDLVDEEILKTMKKAGCHTIIFGVETASPELLKKYRKGYNLEQVEKVFELATGLGIRTVATFLLGLPGETWNSAIATIEFARTLSCSYASLNVAVPRMGTEFRQWAVDRGIVDPDQIQFDQSGSEVMMHTEQLTSIQLQKLKKIAVRKLYLSPKRVLKMLLSLRSLDELLIHFEEAYHLLSRFMGRKL